MKFRYIGVFALSCLFALSLTSCDLLEEPVISTQGEEAKPISKPTLDPNRIYTHEEFLNAKDGVKLNVVGYIQGKQIYNEKSETTTLYIQDDDAGYMVYKLPCTKEQYDNELVIGQKIHVSGEKLTWHGQHEVVNASYSKLEGSKIYDPISFDSLDNEGLSDLAGTKVEFNNLTVIQTNEVTKNSTDFYYQVTDGRISLTFCVETDLCLTTSDEYKEALTIKPGDVIDAEGMMFIYDGAQLHTTKITKHGKNVLTKSEESMSYSEFNDAKDGSNVTIEAFIMDKQTYYEGHTNLYLADENGGYYAYKLFCTEDEYNNKLKLGTKLKIKGLKYNWAGMDEIIGNEVTPMTFEIMEGKYRAPIKDLTTKFESKDLIKHSGELVKFRDLTIVGNVSESKGDLYYDVRYKDSHLTFCVESYLRDPSSEVYNIVSNLNSGDNITVVGYIFVYNDVAQLHTIECILNE